MKNPVFPLASVVRNAITSSTSRDDASAIKIAPVQSLPVQTKWAGSQPEDFLNEFSIPIKTRSEFNRSKHEKELSAKSLQMQDLLDKAKKKAAAISARNEAEKKDNNSKKRPRSRSRSPRYRSRSRSPRYRSRSPRNRYQRRPQSPSFSPFNKKRASPRSSNRRRSRSFSPRARGGKGRQERKSPNRFGKWAADDKKSKWEAEDKKESKEDTFNKMMEQIETAMKN